MNTYGASFSVKYTQELGVDWQNCLEWLLDEIGVGRFRLMSYWDECEPKPGKYNFKDLDYQFEQIHKRGGQVTLCLGLRQPRWPECHQPQWAKQLPTAERNRALLAFIEQVVRRYRQHPALISYQLENEALNRGFGVDCNYNRARIQTEFSLVKRLDSKHPIIMSTSNSWGIPIRAPIGDVIGYSLYRYQHRNGRYSKSLIPAWYQQLRTFGVRFLLNRPVIIHELQAEPWGGEPTAAMPPSQQAELMNDERLETIIKYARATGIRYADIWGAEWWYAQRLHQPELIRQLRNLYN